MVQLQMLEGTGEELQKHLKQHPNERSRLILLAKGSPIQRQSQPLGLRRGMFPELRSLAEEDFKAAEWYGEGSDL